MKRDELKTGMIIIAEDGQHGVVIKDFNGEDVIIYNDGFNYIDELYDDDLNIIDEDDMMYEIKSIIKEHVSSEIYCGLKFYSKDVKPYIYDIATQIYPIVKKPNATDIKTMESIYHLYGYKWFAEDKNGRQYAYDQKPCKNEDNTCWSYSQCEVFEDYEALNNKNKLSHISWEDYEPYEYIPVVGNDYV